MSLLNRDQLFKDMYTYKYEIANGFKRIERKYNEKITKILSNLYIITKCCLFISSCVLIRKIVKVTVKVEKERD